jgi:hypothetical protein
MGQLEEFMSNMVEVMSLGFVGREEELAALSEYIASEPPQGIVFVVSWERGAVSVVDASRLPSASSARGSWHGKDSVLV